MSAERTVAKNAAWLVLQPLVMNVLSLAATGYIARQLGSGDFGRFNLAYAFVAMFAPLANLGLRSLAIRHVAQHRDQAAEYLGRVLVLRLLLAVACATLVALAAPLSGGTGATRTVIAIAAVGMIATTVGGVFTDGFQAFETMRPASLANFAGALLLTAASVAVVWQGGGIAQMAVAYALGPLFSLSLLWLWSRRRPFLPRPNWNLPAFRGMLKEASPFFAITLLDMIGARIDILILARVLGDANLGSYTAALGLVDRLMVLSEGAGTALLPTLAHMSVCSPLAMVPLMRKSALWLLALGLPLAIVTTVLAPLIVTVIFGPQYAAAAPILAIMIWRLPGTCLATLEGQALFAAQRQDLVLRTAAITMLLYTAVIFPLVHVFGIVGAAVALAVRPLVTFLLRLPATAHYFPSFWPWRQMALLLVVLFMMTVPLLFVPSLGLHPGSLALLLAAGGLYVAGLGMIRLIPIKPLIGRLFGRKASAQRLWTADASPSSD